MQLTSEQIAIVQSKGDIKINAVAGSGKTTSLIEYAKPRKAAKILYLAFNKTVKNEAIEKFKAAGLHNIQVETAHSLAYRSIMRHSNYQLTFGYSTFDIKRIMQIVPTSEPMSDYILANHVNKFVSYFCNHAASKVSEINYLDIVEEPHAQEFVQQNYADIVHYTRRFLAKMDKGVIPVTHDFYLKKFQLSNPVLPYDYILFDEGQDASPTMLDVFMKQSATKVIVGDAHQQIYGWRYAINSLDRVNFNLHSLSNSFRFGNEIAALARSVLHTKNRFIDLPLVKITGSGQDIQIKTRATLARTNVALLMEAIEFTHKYGTRKKLYFEGNINSYTYADDGGSIYDVLSLFTNNRRMLRDPLIKSMRTFEQLEEYADKTEDGQLKMMIQIVSKHGKLLPRMIQNIKDLHVADDEKDKAYMIFSTVHKSKGMEYDEVHLANDFLSEENLIKKIKETKNTSYQALSEEINMLYVAITRTRQLLHIPLELLPLLEKNIGDNAQHILIKPEPKSRVVAQTGKKRKKRKPK